jgi:anti-sigma regulatory factor (Ser/Thr protein kinase)
MTDTRNKNEQIWEEMISLQEPVEEDIVWRNKISPLLLLPENAMDIWHYGFTELLNNAIEHSAAQQIYISLSKTTNTTELEIFDDGEGIFKKIQRELGLHDERHAVLELAKGKLTTDPDNHTGKGIFFSSRMFDEFLMFSGTVYFSHTISEDWILENQEDQPGTRVLIKLNNHTARTAKEIFDNFTVDDDYGFTKTIVPVRLAQYGDEKLISRSQAKRLLARIDCFKTVIFDFDKVNSIGQAFADEVFRVFNNKNPSVSIMQIKANQSIMQMIHRALKR